MRVEFGAGCPPKMASMETGELTVLILETEKSPPQAFLDRRRSPNL